MPSETIIFGFSFATGHPLDALLSISSRPWPMPCTSTKPSHTFSSSATRLAMRELRSVGWSDAERLGEVVCESGWIRAKICGASLGVMGSHLILIGGFAWLNLEPFQDLVGSWTVCSM